MATLIELIESLCEEFPGLDPEALTGESRLKDELGLSSLDVVLVRAKLQDSFGAVLSDSDIISATTLIDLLNKVNAGT